MLLQVQPEHPCRICLEAAGGERVDALKFFRGEDGFGCSGSGL